MKKERNNNIVFWQMKSICIFPTWISRILWQALVKFEIYKKNK
jgi:hypothetical protein